MRQSFGFRFILVTAAANLCAVAVASPQQAAADSRALVQRLRASIVIITGEDGDDQPIPPGLGFVIGRNLIATDDRVVSRGQRLHVKLVGQENSLVAAGVPDSYRLASILTAMTPSLNAPPLVLGDSDKVAPNDRVYIFSGPHPQSEVWEVVVNRITRLNQKRYLELSAPLTAGIKGGPVFNAKGEVIGILGESPEGPHVTLAIPSSYLSTLVEARNVDEPSRTTGRRPAEAEAGEGVGQGTGKDNPPRSGAGSGSGGNAGATQKGPHGDASLALRSGTRPRALNQVRPQYSEEARSNLTKGIVRVRILVGADGEVKDARVIKGLPDHLNERAVAAVSQLKFKPGTREGAPVASWLAVDVEFLLR